MNVGRVSTAPSGSSVILKGKSGRAIDIANVPTSIADLQNPFKMGVLQSLGDLLAELLTAKEALTDEQKGGLLIVRGRLSTLKTLLQTRPDWLQYVEGLLGYLNTLVERK